MPSVRAVKSSKLKLSILTAAKELIGKKSFHELFVLDICNQVKISKVTLFKYFPQKEDILLYYLRIWCLQLAVGLKKQPKEGADGIHYVGARIADEYEKYPGIWRSLIGYMANMNTVAKPYPIKEERTLLYGDDEQMKSVEIRSVEQVIEGFILEAIFRGEIVKNTHTADLSDLIMSVIYGTIITAHLHDNKPIKLYFRNNIELVLRGLK